MTLTVLSENTPNPVDIGLKAEHGLSIHISLNDYSILYDFGPRGTLVPNSEKLGIRLQDVNLAVLSHGHYDHAGDLDTFLRLNKKVTVIIDSVSDVRDKYNRLLGYIKLQDGSVFNEMLIETGHGYADLRFDHTDFDKYAEIMDQATKYNTGLWQQVKKEQLPNWLKRERPGLLRDRK